MIVLLLKVKLMIPFCCNFFDMFFIVNNFLLKSIYPILILFPQLSHFLINFVYLIFFAFQDPHVFYFCCL